MYAIIQDGGRQYRVAEGDEFDIDYRDVPPGEKIVFDRVLAAGEGADLKLGQPLLEGAKVTANVLGIRQGPKLTVQKLRRRKNSRRRTGHRQLYTKVQISQIEA